MAGNTQVGYGHSDVVGFPFDFYGTSLTTGTVINMQTALLVISAGATLAALTVNLPLNPTDGALAAITTQYQVTSLTINANTGDLILNGTEGAVTEIIPVASGTAGSAASTVQYRYSLNGDIIKGYAPRTWIRVQ
jgi:hypothetical protein